MKKGQQITEKILELIEARLLQFDITNETLDDYLVRKGEKIKKVADELTDLIDSCTTD